MVEWYWQRQTIVSGKILPDFTLSVGNPTRIVLGLNSGLRHNGSRTNNVEFINITLKTWFVPHSEHTESSVRSIVFRRSGKNLWRPSKWSVQLVEGWRICVSRKHFAGPRYLSLSHASLIFLSRPESLHWEENVCVCVCIYIVYRHIYTHLTVYRLYMNYLCYQLTCEWNIFRQIGSGAKCWMALYQLGAGLAVTGRTRDIGQNVLQSSFQTESSGSPTYCHIFLLIAFLEEAFIENVIIILCINYTV